jgi:hypothetical protein
LHRDIPLSESICFLAPVTIKSYSNIEFSILRLKGFAIVLLIFLSLLPAYYINQWLQKIIQPRKSFGLFLLYMLACFALVFGYTFLVTMVIFKLFPLSKR